MPRLKHEDVTDHIRKSLAAPGKMIKISDGQNLILIARNGRGYWSYQFRDGMSARTKVLGNAPEMSPAKARQAREKLAVQRRDGAQGGGKDRQGALVRRDRHSCIEGLVVHIHHTELKRVVAGPRCVVGLNPTAIPTTDGPAGARR